MDESEAGVNLAKQMEKEKEQEAGKPGDMGAIDRSHSLNLNTAPPPVAVEARGTVENGENGEIHRAEVSGAKDSMAGKPEQSSGVDQKLPKCEQVDYESETEGCENPADKDALVTVVGNEGLAGFGNEDERAQVLTIVKKDESADEVGDSINPLAAVVYREEKVVVGASTEISAVRPAGSRSSSFHGVTRHRWSGKYEAHLWDSSCRVEGRRRKGKQVYLGSYDTEEKAARSYDVAALKYWGENTRLNFPISQYEKELDDIRDLSREECVTYLRRRSSCFSRGASIYRGVTRRQKDGRWQARIGLVAGTRDIYLGTFKTEEEAAEAYDIAAIEIRGKNAVTNFDRSNYVDQAFSEARAVQENNAALLQQPRAVGGMASRPRGESCRSVACRLVVASCLETNGADHRPPALRPDGIGRSRECRLCAPVRLVTCGVPSGRGTPLRHRRFGACRLKLDSSLKCRDAVAS